MQEVKQEGYIKPGEFLFISPRYPQLSVQVGGHGYMPNGRPERPIFAQFHPGPFGGELRTKDAKLAELLRERDGVDDHYQEVSNDSELAEIARLRDQIVEDKGDKVVQGSSFKKVKPASEQAAPANAGHAPAAAAKGPKSDKF